MIVPGGGLANDGSRWISCKPDFLLPVRVLSKLFRRLMLTKLAAAHERGQLQFFGTHAHLADAKAFAAFLAPLRSKRWFVYTKRPFAGPKAVLAYLSRYTHRVAISNRRLIALDHRRVTFKVKNYRIEGPGRYTTMTLDIGEFIRRFLIHVLPKGFHRIRHYGLFVGNNRAETIEHVRKLLNVAPPAADASAKAQQPSQTDEAQPLSQPCPCCGGRMFVIETFKAGCQPHYRPTEATKTLQRRASGDLGPDQREAMLAPADHSLAVLRKGVPNAPLGKSRVRGTTALTATELFQAYVADKHPAPRTVSRWQGVFTALDAAGWQAPGWDAQGWLDGLKTEKHADGTPLRKPITVRDIWLGAPRAVFTWAVRHKKAAHNPFAGCVVEVPRAKVTRETGRAFTEAEALTILRAALTTPINPKQRFTAVKRWVPWIAAYTGARAGELTQLRRQDVESRPGVGWVIRITPEAGTVKTGDVRVVPLHADLVKQGFPAWVERQPSGPLFHHRPAKPSRNPNYRGPAVKATERLAKWVRSLGIDHPEVKPNHGWRHTFKSRAIQAGIDARVRDAIVGHAPRTVADAYEHPTVADMVKALKRFPPYAVEVTPRRGEPERLSSATPV